MDAHLTCLPQVEPLKLVARPRFLAAVQRLGAGAAPAEETLNAAIGRGLGLLSPGAPQLLARAELLGDSAPHMLVSLSVDDVEVRRVCDKCDVSDMHRAAG